MRFAGMLAVALAAAAQTKSPTLEQLMSGPFPSSLTAAPAGGHVAWVQNAAGVRNIWVASPPDYSAKAITPYKSDDGQEIASLVFSPGGDAIVYVRGGDANRAGEIPNPMSDPAGAEQAVWVVPTGGGEPKRIGEGAAPVVSAKGRVAFLQKGQVWSAPLDGSAKPEHLIKARGVARELRWSPDGSQLAFVSNRGDHAYIGVYSEAAKAVRFLDPSVDSDSDPAWSPDGKQIAFLRMAASKEFVMFGARRTAEPWSIRVADVATGKSQAVFTADPGRGSTFYPMEAANQILWASTGHLVFPWERDGWLHLYSIPVQGGTSARLLTFGDFEVEHVALTPDGKEVLYSANSDDPERRHVYRVAAGGGPVNPITSGKGIEWSPVMTSDGKAVALLRSDARVPARAAILAAFSAPRDLAPFEFPGDALVEPQPVALTGADGFKMRGQLFLPAGAPQEKKPAMIFFHGGSRRQMLLGWHYLPYYHHTYAMNQYLASRGYVVLSVNYRSGIGYGMEFREALNHGATGASEFNDVMGAGLYLQSRADVDAKRIGLWGGSYGGYLTALGLARASDLFAAGVDIHGVHDWNVVIKGFRPSYDPRENPDRARVAFESSPMAGVKGWRSPVLLIHGDDDRNVPFSESVTMAEALRKQGVEFEQLVFPDEIHGFLRHSRWLEVFRASADFLDRKLKKK
ncbi:MAG: prolyl oligopeptidase family serine peptidase [Bryobacteraceae bacterium]